MRILTILLFTLCSLFSEAKNYYVSPTGNDSNNGLSTGAAWRTIFKANASVAFAIGDSLLFQRGGVYTGTLVLRTNGSLASPIVIGAYGTGVKPVISGMVTLGGWSSVGTNLWECTPDSTLKSNCNILTINGVPQAVGRTVWMVYQSATKTQLTSTSLTGTPSYVGAEIVMKKNSYTGEKALITAQSGSTVTYAQTAPIANGQALPASNGTPGFGFFLQRFAGSLDTQGEWYYNPATSKMRIYSTVNPATLTIKASFKDSIIVVGGRTNIIVTDLNIEGGGMYGVEGYGSTNIQVKNCTVNNCTLGIYLWNVNDAMVSGDSVTNCFNGGILVSNNQAKRVNIINNTVLNIGQLIGNGLYWSDYNLKGIVGRDSISPTSNFLNIIGNTVRNTGHAGIQFQGSNVAVSRNVVDTFCNQLDDNGGIYTFVNNQTVNNINYVSRRVDSNFILHTSGAPTGANGVVDVAGYYMDDQTLNVSGVNNTIAHVGAGGEGNGVQMNNPVNLAFRYNTIYNCENTFNINKKSFSNITNVQVKSNILYQKTTAQLAFFHTNNDLSKPTSITIQQSMSALWNMDSNWVSNQAFSPYRYYYRVNDSAKYQFPPNLTYAQWQGSPYLHDSHSILPPSAITPTNTNIFPNPAPTVLTVDFTGFSKVDPKGNVYNNSVDVAAWSSIVLIDNGTVPLVNKIPTANAGADQTIELPTNSVTLTGSGNDSDGVIVAYKWTQISGPNIATFSSSTSASTTASGLIIGIYQFRLTVTDNSGATGTAITKVTVNPSPNQRPTVNAGSDVTITSPTSSTSLTATASDADGSIVAIKWTKISGGTGGTISNSTALFTNISGLQVGVYQYQIKVTDNAGDTAIDVVQITVNPPVIPNAAPIANAGSNQTITLPTNTTTLSGSATDADGTVVSHVWTKISGGTGGDISNPASYTPTISNLVEGIYQYQLSVTDDDGAVGTAVMTITVNAAIIPNQNPVANAGSDSTIQLPTNTTHLVGYAVDAEDSLLSYHWDKISGPSGGAITYPDSSYTPVTGLGVGTYQYQLTATDSDGGSATDLVQIIVQPAVIVNQNPTVSAGSDILMTLPLSDTSFTATANDVDGTVIAAQWSRISGPSGGNIVTSNSLYTRITNLQVGTYQYQILVTDNNGGTGTSLIQITVFPAVVPNQIPIVNAGADMTITAPKSDTTVVGAAIDPDGSIVSTLWAKVSGPSGGVIVSASSLTSVINTLQVGTYQFQLSATDNNGGVGTDLIQIIVLPPVVPNQNPTVSAGSAMTITLPTTTTTLTGSASDVDGSIASVQWTKVSGPAGGTITSPNSTTTGITALQQGNYTFQLLATDDDGGTATAITTVTVNPAIILINPVAEAGASRQITLPKDSVHLIGSGTDADGTIVSKAWTQISGPTTATIVTPTAYATQVTGLAQGTYVFQLEVTDNDSLKGTDLIQVIVLAQQVIELNTIHGWEMFAN